LRDGDESDSGESEPSDAIDLADTDGEGESEEEAADVADSEDERFLREGDEAKEDVDYERLATMRRVHMEEEDAEAAQQVGSSRSLWGGFCRYPLTRSVTVRSGVRHYRGQASA
jgi:hypothetical protein